MIYQPIINILYIHPPNKGGGGHVLVASEQVLRTGPSEEINCFAVRTWLLLAPPRRRKQKVAVERTHPRCRESDGCRAVRSRSVACHPSYILSRLPVSPQRIVRFCTCFAREEASRQMSVHSPKSSTSYVSESKRAVVSTWSYYIERDDTSKQMSNDLEYSRGPPGDSVRANHRPELDSLSLTS